MTVRISKGRMGKYGVPCERCGHKGFWKDSRYSQRVKEEYYHFDKCICSKCGHAMDIFVEATLSRDRPPVTVCGSAGCWRYVGPADPQIQSGIKKMVAKLQKLNELLKDVS